jgi:glycopeptide antibiotics resistance protein
MKQQERIIKVFLYAIFLSYLLLLFKILLLSRVSLTELFDNERTLFSSINLIPFHSITEYMFSNSDSIRSFAFGNVVGNIAVFIPFGIYLPLFKKDKRVLTNRLIILLVSLSVEIIQGLLDIGVTDIDDIILNCMGGWIGILGYRIILLILQREEKVATAITVLSYMIGLPISIYLLFMIKMRF